MAVKLTLSEWQELKSKRKAAERAVQDFYSCMMSMAGCKYHSGEEYDFLIENINKVQKSSDSFPKASIIPPLNEDTIYVSDTR